MTAAALILKCARTIERQRYGIIPAKMRSFYRRRKKGPNADQACQLSDRVAASETKDDVAQNLCISCETVYQRKTILGRRAGGRSDLTTGDSAAIAATNNI